MLVNCHLASQVGWRLILVWSQIWLPFLLASLLSWRTCLMAALPSMCPVFLLLCLPCHAQFTAGNITEVKYEFLGVNGVLFWREAGCFCSLSPREAFRPPTPMLTSQPLIAFVVRAAEWVAGFLKWTPVFQRQSWVTTSFHRLLPGAAMWTQSSDQPERDSSRKFNDEGGKFRIFLPRHPMPLVLGAFSISFYDSLKPY